MPRKGGFYFDRSSQILENDCDQEDATGRVWGHKSNEEHEKKGILTEEIMSYYRHVSTTLQEQGFDKDSPDAKKEFLNNVFSALKEECVTVSSNQTVSRILEYLFTHSSPHHLKPIFEKFCKELSLVVFDAFSSHVFQALIQYLPIMFVDDSDANHETDLETLRESTDKLCGFMESHLRDIMTHVYGSHVLRSLLEVLGGIPVNSEIVRSRMSRKQSYKKDGVDGPKTNRAASESFSNLYKKWFETLSHKIIKLCNYEDHLNDKHYCPVLQSVLLILHKTAPDQYEAEAAKIIERTCSTSPIAIQTEDITQILPQVVQNEISSYLIELMISLSSGSEFENLYNSLFKGRLLYFSVHPFANYVLQKLLSCINEESLMLAVLDDMCKYIEDILAVNHCGLITKLAAACQRTGVGEKKFIDALMAAFHCFEPESRQNRIVPLLASFQTYEVFFKDSEDKENVSSVLKSVLIHGSLILQQLLQFSKPAVVVNSLLAMSQSELLFLSCDKCGSHIIDVFFQSPTVKEKYKDAFIKQLQGLYINMACNRNGSRCLENTWKMSTMQQKVLIAEDLMKNQERLEGDHIGKFILRNFALLKFKTRRKEWKQIQGIDIKKQELLKGILEGKKKKKSNVNGKDFNKKGSEEIEQSQSLSTPDAIEKSKKKKKKTKNEDVEEQIQYAESIISTPDTERRKKKKKKVKVDVTFETISSETEEICVVKKKKQKKEKKRKEQVSDMEENKTVKKRKVRPTQDEESIPLKKKKKAKKTFQGPDKED